MYMDNIPVISSCFTIKHEDVVYPPLYGKPMVSDGLPMDFKPPNTLGPCVLGNVRLKPAELTYDRTEPQVKCSRQRTVDVSH